MLAEPQEGEMGDVSFVLLKGVVRKGKLAHLRFRVRDVASVLLNVGVRERNWPTCAAEFWTDVIGVSLARLRTDLWYTSRTYGIGLCSARLQCRPLVCYAWASSLRIGVAGPASYKKGQPPLRPHTCMSGNSEVHEQPGA